VATLQALGVADLFCHVVGLDDTLKSKPAREPFLLAARHALAGPDTATRTELSSLETELSGTGTELGTGFAACLAVGDRYDVDLAVPLELGMGAVLVDGVQDVYLIPGLLSST
jgi:phosphoglycolate phosphatase/putative hydrolase of the HAD superfamily